MTVDLQNRLAAWAADHTNPTNRLLHWIAVPLVLWGAIALLWLVPVPESIGKPGFVAAAVMFVVYLSYLRHSHHIAWAIATGFIVLGTLTAGAHHVLGPHGLLVLGIALLAAGHAGVFIGHHLEGRTPRVAGLVNRIWLAPAWLAARVLARFHVDY